MRRRYDSSSQASSLYSHSQPVTRASSTTAVASDDVFGPNHYNGGYDGLKDSKFIEDPLIDVQALVSRATSAAELSDSEPYGPYFSLPPDPTSDIVPLTRRKTTKELIGRYESLSHQQSATSPGATSSIEIPKRAFAAKANASEKKGKGRSPIRQSLRNLLSVFNKKGKVGKDAAIMEESTSIALEVKKPSPLHIRTATDLPLAKMLIEAEQPHACTSPVPLYSGSLLHLCYPESADTLPVWTSCDVVLHPSHILVTWLTNLGNPSTSLVPFEHCTDVRSLALSDLDATERNLLPSSEGTELKPFELLFEGKAKEKFAATSVKERAGWVSAIWDVVLKTNAEKSSIYSPSLMNPHSTYNRDPSPQLSLSPTYLERQSLSPTRQSSIHPSIYSVERELPAVPHPSPAQSKRAKFELYDPPVPKSTPPPSISSAPIPPKSSFLTPPPSSRPQSPSIRNLDQRSVVKQRLAEIERTASLRSDDSAQSEKSTRSRQIVRTPTSGGSAIRSYRNVPPSLSVRTSGISRDGGGRSPGGESIIDSYGRESPLSAYSGRLTSIPSGESLKDRMGLSPMSPTPTRRLSTRNVPKSASPLSRFSLDAPSLKPPAPPLNRLASHAASPASRSTTGAAQTRSMFVQHAHPPPSPSVSTGRVIPRAAELRMHIEQDRRIAALQDQLATVPSRHGLAEGDGGGREDKGSVREDKGSAREDKGSGADGGGKGGGRDDPGINMRVEELQAQVANMQEGLRTLPQDLRNAVAERVASQQSVQEHPVSRTHEVDEGTKPILESIDDSVKRIEDQGERNAQGLMGVHAKVDAIMALHAATGQTALQGAEQVLLPTPGGLPALGVLPSIDVSAIVNKLDEVRAELKGELPMLAERLEALIAEKLSAASAVKNGIPDGTGSGGGGFTMSNVPPQAEGFGGTGISAEDVAVIRSKLDELLTAHQSTKDATEQAGSEAVANANSKTDEVLELLKSDQIQRTQQMEQQADNARYLNELNSWLETFVTHGTSQIECIAAGVHRLSSALGVMSSPEQVGPDGQAMLQDPAGGGLLADVRRLLLEHNEISGDSAALHESVAALVGVVQDDMVRRGAEAQSGLTADSIVGLIDRQRQDQERMLRTLATELSNDIRGERLRFVEAMKEATTINVQIHVEEFKKELTREVLSMTQDVARLHRERQTLEQQIADLFAFYARQKQNGEHSQKSAAPARRRAAPLQQHHSQQKHHQQQQHQQQQQYFQEPGPGDAGGAPPPSRGRRPLPSPQPRGMPGALQM